MTVTVVEVDAATVRPLRHVVLREGRPETESVYPQDELPEAFHLAVLDEHGRVVACGTFFPEPYEGRSAWRLRGMATDAGVRGLGYGSALMHDALLRLSQRGADLLWCNARETALGFYRRFGFTTVGEEFVSVGVPHYVALLEVTATPKGTST